MAWLYRQKGIIFAGVFAASLVAAAYFSASGTATPPRAGAADAASLLQAIATRDSNGDGLPDWEKVLYGIPLNATTTDYFHLGMTDGEAVARGLIVPKAVVNVPTVQKTSSSSLYASFGLPPPPAPGTLTDAFAKNFFLLYLKAKEANGGAPLSAAQEKDIATQALTQLAQAVNPAPNFKSAQDLTISGSGPDALRTFATKVGNFLQKKVSTATSSEIVYLKEALQDSNNTGPLKQISSIAESYQNMAAGLAAIPVPQELAPADLALINATARLGELISDFTKVNTDPVATMVALQKYPQAVLNFGRAFVAIHNVYASANITLPEGSPAEEFVNIIPTIGAQQKAGTLKTP